MKSKVLFDFIKNNDIITIFHHERADYDALGACFALKLYLEKYYQKTVYVLGDDYGSIANEFPKIVNVSDEIIKNSVAIILDTANINRIDDNRILLAQKRLKIDHHINIDQYADIEIVDENAAATCEILGEIFKENNYPLNNEIAKYLYLGIISDTISFSTTNTTTKTLKIAAYISQFIDKINEVTYLVYKKSIDEFKYENYLKQQIQYKNDIAYVVIEDEYNQFNVSKEKAKDMVYIMANVEGIEKWALIIKMKDGYGVSLRSKRIPVNELANKYNGGGHRNAAGLKNLPKEKIPQLINELANLK